MLIKHHDLEAYYLKRRLELLQIFDALAQKAYANEEAEIDNDQQQIKFLENEYVDVIDPDALCKTLQRIYPEDLFSIKSKI